MNKIAWLTIGLIFGFLGGVGSMQYRLTGHTPSDTDIVFAKKQFLAGFVGNREYIVVSGTLTGEGLGYPNNTHAVSCWQHQKECYVASIEQIGPNQISRLDGPWVYPVVKWTANQVVAQEDAPCARTTLTLDRNPQVVLWVHEPINQTEPSCARSETKIKKYSLDDSIGWKRTEAASKKSKE